MDLAKPSAFSDELRQFIFKKINARAKKVDDCLLWTNRDGSLVGNWYPSFEFKKVRYYVHRASFEAAYSLNPGSLFVCHSCDRKACVNPKHLWLGTRLDNAADWKGKGLSLSGEKNGRAKLTLAKAEKIRVLYAAGDVTYKELSNLFGVSDPIIADVLHGRRWL